MAPGFTSAASRANTGSEAVPPVTLLLTNGEIQLIEYRDNRILQRLAQPSKSLVSIER
jgi:hypothetical protein